MGIGRNWGKRFHIYLEGELGGVPDSAVRHLIPYAKVT
jgi:hypothetical protein